MAHVVPVVHAEGNHAPNGATTDDTRRAVLTVAATLAIATATIGIEIADPIHLLLIDHAEACRLADAAREDCDAT